MKPLEEVRTIDLPNGRKRIIYKGDDGRECYFAPGSRVPKLLFVEDELISDEGALDPIKLLKELSAINTELSGINQEAKRCSRGFPGTRLETNRLRVNALRHRAALLLRLLDKSLPDKRSLHHSGSVSLTNTIDNIPDDVLIAAVAGKLTERQQEQMELLMTETLGGEH